MCLLFTALFTQASDKPNIVFILIDDLSHYGVSAYGAVELNSTQGFFDPFRSPRRKSTDWLKKGPSGQRIRLPDLRAHPSRPDDRDEQPS